LLKRLSGVLEKGLEATEPLFAPVRRMQAFVERAASLLDNPMGLPGRVVCWAYQGLLSDLASVRNDLFGTFSEQEHSAADHFLGVSVRYGADLFHCYDHPDLPRTNNGMEQYFGSYRYHERRCSGRKVGCGGTVIRGSVRLVSSGVTRLRAFSAEDLSPRDVNAWRTLRQNLDTLQESRRQQRRFRHDPKAYLAGVEDELLKGTLPS